MRRLRHFLLGMTGIGALMTLSAGTVSYYEEGLPSTMNPLFARKMSDRRSHELVFDRIFYRSPITNNLRSRLVSKTEKLEGGKKLKVWLKPDIKWHDGKPLTAADVCFTIDAMLDRRTPSPKGKEVRESIAGCEAPGAKDPTFTVEYVKAFHNPRERLAFHVIPKHLFDSTAISPDLEFSTRPIGTGSMKASKGRREVKFTAVPNAHHKAQIGAMSMAEGADPFVQVRTLLNAGVQGLISVPPPLRPDVAASDDVALKGYDLRSWWFIAVNTNNGAMRYQQVRQAINYTLDRDELRRLTIGVTPDDPNPPCEFVSGPFVQSSPYYNRAVNVISTSDKNKARYLMQQAGATDSAGRWLMDGEPIDLRIGMRAPLDIEAKDLTNQVGNQLQAGGFGTRTFKVTDDDWTVKAITGRLSEQYDLLIGKWSFGVVEDVNPMFQTRGGGKGTLNIFNYSNGEADKIMDRFDSARTDTEAKDAYHELHQFLAGDLPYIFLWKLDTKSAWRNEVRGGMIAPYYYFTDFDDWTIQ
jgi:peptide/nickel transport system substrate-binding protein